jgi:4-cresol dehydrogenase (hydroxylating)
MTNNSSDLNLSAAQPHRDLPEGTTLEQWNSAIAEFQSLLGTDSVLLEEQEVAEFDDPYQATDVPGYRASAVVQPTDVEQIQEIVRIANRYTVPLAVNSQGRNNAYGGAAPRLNGAVTINLRKMNKVLHIDEELAYAVVEPGVKWSDLYDEIQSRGYKLMLTLPDLGWGSVVGNTLENGLTYLPPGYDQNAACGLEVVLPDGELMRTGMGAMEGNSSWHTYHRSLGPSADLLFYQSNFGIVTKMGFWLMPEPEVYHTVRVKAWKEDDLGPLVETIRALQLDGTVNAAPQLSNTLLSASLGNRRADWWTGEGPIPDHVIDQIARDLDVGRWMIAASLYGDRTVVRYNFEKIKAAFEAIDGVEVTGEEYRPSEVAALPDSQDRVLGGVPDLSWLNMPGWFGAERGGHVDLAPVVPATAEDIVRVKDLLRTTYEKGGLDYMCGLVGVNSRSWTHISMTPFDLDNAEQTDTAYKVTQRLVPELAELGYGEYRAHVDYMDLATEQFSFNDHAQRRFNERIKDTLDPNGILAPGKQGIWPARFRKSEA